jgi:hypothetical protein
MKDKKNRDKSQQLGFRLNYQETAFRHFYKQIKEVQANEVKLVVKNGKWVFAFPGWGVDNYKDV